jgi:hypothetical protein
MAANGTYARGMLVIRHFIHKLVLRRKLANNIGRGVRGIGDKIDHVF